MLLAAVAVTATALASPLTFRPARQVVDLNTVPIPLSSEPRHACHNGGVAYFQAIREGSVGLWRTDGTAGGTTLVRNVAVESPQTSIECAGFSATGLGYFVVTDPQFRSQLWRSDGTGAGTFAVTDIVVQGSLPPFVRTFFPDGRVLFAYDDGVHGNEFWVSDGTVAGTHLLVDLVAGTGASNLFAGGTLSGNDFYFAFAGNPWKTDGTASGTKRIADIGTPLGNVDPLEFTRFGGSVLFFAATQSATGELWKTDGVTATRVTAPFTSSGGFAPQGLTALGSRAVFRVFDTGAGTSELWSTDGTNANTQRLGAAVDLGATSFVTTLAGRLVFTGNVSQGGDELWSTNGTEVGTIRLNDAATVGGHFSAPPQATAAHVIYSFGGASGNSEVWATDGTLAGTRRLGDFDPTSNFDPLRAVVGDSSGTYLFSIVGNGVSFGARGTVRRLDAASGVLSVVTQLDVDQPESLDVVNGKWLFRNTDPVFGSEPWISDGTAAGTKVLKDIAPSVRNADGMGFPVATFGGAALLRADDGVHGQGLWRSDGTAAGTQFLAQVIPEDAPHIGVPSIEINGRFVFAGTDNRGNELWQTDGTAAGTTLIADLFQGDSPFGSGIAGRGQPGNCGGFARLGGFAYFGARTGEFSYELLRTDGTSAGTARVDGFIGSGGTFSISTVCVIGEFKGQIYYLAVENGLSFVPVLWRTDGSGVAQKVLDEAGSSLNGVSSIAQLGGNLYFSASDGNRSGLYRYDGTAAGARVIVPRDDSDPTAFGPYNPTALGNFLFYVTCRGPSVTCTLWRSDGTAGSEVSMALTTATVPAVFGEAQGKLLFPGRTPAHGTELWVTDGTAAGTRELADIVPGPDGSNPTNFVDFNGLTYFIVEQPVINGFRGEFWRTDGTPEGTVRIDNVAPRAVAWGATVFRSVVGQQLLFPGEDSETGVELWAIENTQPVAVADAGTTTAGTAVTVNVLANDSDPDGALDVTKVKVLQQPAHGAVSVVATSGAIQYTPSAGYTGADSFSYAVTDNQQFESAPATVNMTVNAAPGGGGGGGGDGTRGGRRGGGGALDLEVLLLLAGALALATYCAPSYRCRPSRRLART